MLIYLDFTQPFIIEINIYDVGVGSVLLQQNHPMAYFSKKLSPLCQQASTYAKELWVITDAIWKWRHYFLGGTFMIKTDYHSLKNLLGQMIQTLE